MLEYTVLYIYIYTVTVYNMQLLQNPSYIYIYI